METPEQRSRTMRAVRSKETGAELKVRRALREMGQTGYRLHRPDLPGTPDVVFIGRRRAIFIHGCFWHGHDCKRGSRTPKTNRDYWAKKIARNSQRDQDNIASLEALGWGVLVLWECELKEREKLKARLSDFLGAGQLPART